MNSFKVGIEGKVAETRAYLQSYQRLKNRRSLAKEDYFVPLTTKELGQKAEKLMPWLANFAFVEVPGSYRVVYNQ